MNYVGVGEFKVVGFNPSKERLNRRGFNVKTEPVYVGEDRDIKTVKIVPVFQSLQYPDFFTFATFDLKHNLAISKSGNRCYANPRGQIAWAPNEEHVPAWMFTSGDLIQLNEGEPLFYDFLRVWLSEVEEINFDREFWYGGALDELNRTINSGVTVGAAVVVEKNLNGRTKNKIYHKKFLPANEIDHFRGDVFSKEYVKKLIDQDRINKDKKVDASGKRNLSEWQRLLVSMNDPNFPCQDFFHNGYIKPYVSEENIIEKEDILIK